MSEDSGFTEYDLYLLMFNTFGRSHYMIVPKRNPFYQSNIIDG
jgi:hypothetical protein